MKILIHFPLIIPNWQAANNAELSVVHDAFFGLRKPPHCVYQVTILHIVLTPRYPQPFRYQWSVRASKSNPATLFPIVLDHSYEGPGGP